MTTNTTTEQKKDDTLSASEALQNELSTSYALVKKLLPFMATRSIPVSPQNYHLFYDYLSDVNPELTKTINGLLSSKACFHPQLSKDLYHYFCVGRPNETALSKATSDFMAMSDTLKQGLFEAQNQTSHFLDVLTDSSKQMTAVVTPDELQTVLGELLHETELALAAHNDFSSNITKANKIIALLKEELRAQTNLALIDELTKLHNRRHLYNEAPPLLALATEQDKPLSAIALDLDFFKRINDTWGHQCGDKVLVITADILRNCARSEDILVRMGGEEFLLICPGLDLMQAAKKAEKIRLAIFNTEITVRNERLPVTTSAGVAQHLPNEPLNTLIERSDAALYQAKNEGINKVCLNTHPNSP
ncbi:MAG: GGDEF domain-containing protein [Candidatus Adiutrix sp.]